MTVNSNQTPNRLIKSGDTEVKFHFGAALNVSPVPARRNGTAPHLTVHFAYGLLLELTPTTASELADGITKALRRIPMPQPMPNLSGALADVEEA